MSKDVGLFVGARIDRLEALIKGLEFETQRKDGSGLLAAQDREAHCAEQAGDLGNELACPSGRTHAGAVWRPIDLDIGVCDHVP